MEQSKKNQENEISPIIKFPLLISLFFFISIIIKIIKDKTKASLKTKPKYLIHDYHDTID